MLPVALRQLGAKVEMLDADQLAWGDLTRYDAIITGVRAYEKRPDLEANNQAAARLRGQRRHAEVVQYKPARSRRLQRCAVRALSVPG